MNSLDCEVKGLKVKVIARPRDHLSTLRGIFLPVAVIHKLT